MLIDITLANFRSIKDPQTISFQALKGWKKDQSTVQQVSPKLGVLRAVSVIGPNGVGKSTVVRALEAVKGLVMADASEQNPLKRVLASSLFAYSDTKNKPAEFTLRFLIKEAEYRTIPVPEDADANPNPNPNPEYIPEIIATYTIKADLHHIWEESLFYTFGNSTKLMFDRVAVTSKLDDVAYNVRWGKYYRGDKKRNEKAVDCRHTFIQNAAEKGGETCSEVYNWFTNVLDILPMGVATSSEHYIASVISAHPKWKNQLINFLWSMDITDIRDIKIASVKDGKIVEGPDGDMVLFIHGTAKAAMLTPYAKESLSLKRLSLLASAFFLSFVQPKVLVVDDYGMFLHPEVIIYLTNVFTQGCKRASQLFAVDCNPTLLEDGLLRRDGIYFAEKDSIGATIYYPLSNFRIGPNGKARAMYESGAFGSLPITSEFHFVNEEA